MNQGPNNDGKHRAALRDALDRRSPDEWVRMLNKLVVDDLTRYWMANIILFGSRGNRMFGTSIDDLAQNYQADHSIRTEADKKSAYELLGLPFFSSPADNTQPSYQRNGPNRQKINLANA